MDDALMRTCRSMGERLAVNPEVHAEDFILAYLLDHPGFKAKTDAVEYYFNDGARSAKRLDGLVTEVCKERPLDLLEFAAGYGCVTRHLAGAMPGAKLTSCDIHAGAVEFLGQTLATRAIPSTSDPDRFRTSERYDVVFALSFFSHMPKETFGRWLNALARCLKPGGHLIFTTHGVVSARNFPDCRFDDEGFYFLRHSEQKDLDLGEYGTTATTPRYVIDLLYRDTPLSLIYFQQAFWWEHQDVFVAKAGA